MQRKTAFILILISLAAALAIALAPRFIPRKPQTRTIDLARQILVGPNYVIEF